MFKTLICIGALASFAVAQSPVVGSCSVFPADNIWNTRIDLLPVSPNSATWISTIGAAKPVHPDFGSGTYNGAPIGIPFVTVPGTQTKYSATFLYQSDSDTGPYAIPLTAPIEGGSTSTGDRHATSIDLNNCILYEIYAAYPQAASWTGDSGAIFNLLSNALRPASLTSADAAGLPIFSGLLRYDEVLAGEIRHALRFTVPQTRKAYIWPARHYASSLTGAQYPPMGARFRLKASFNISAFSAANRIILTALKRYGMMLADNGSAWYLSGTPDGRWNNDDLHALTRIAGSNFEAVDVAPLMVNVDSGQALQSSVQVSLSPASVSVRLNAQADFNSIVTGNSNTAVTWDVNGAVGGNSSVGFIDSISGLYTAPSVLPSPATVVVHATSNAVNSAVGRASVTITNPQPISVSISPTSASVSTGSIRQFTARSQSGVSMAAIWKVNGIVGGNYAVGTINSGGIFTAPAAVPSSALVTVSAISVADQTKSASVAVTITLRYRARTNSSSKVAPEFHE